MKKTGIPLQFACFQCRKSFKRPQFVGSISRFMISEQREKQQNEANEFERKRRYKCPDCGGDAHYMGIDFKAPKKTDIREWNEAKMFIESGNLFIRKC